MPTFKGKNVRQLRRALRAGRRLVHPSARSWLPHVNLFLQPHSLLDHDDFFNRSKASGLPFVPHWQGTVPGGRRSNMVLSAEFLTKRSKSLLRKEPLTKKIRFMLLAVNFAACPCVARTTLPAAACGGAERPGGAALVGGSASASVLSCHTSIGSGRPGLSRFSLPKSTGCLCHQSLLAGTTRVARRRSMRSPYRSGILSRERSCILHSVDDCSTRRVSK